MGVVNDPIEYGVGECRLADDIVPCLDGQLAGEQDRAGAVALFDDFHEIASLRRGQPVGTPVVEDQQVGADECNRGKTPGGAVCGMVRLIDSVC